MTEFKYFPFLKLFKFVKIKHKLTKSELEIDGEYPCYSSDTNNYGILGYTSNPDFIVNDECPMYLIFGDHTRTMRIATKSFSVLDNVKVLIPPFSNIEALLYIIAVWHKSIPDLGYARHWKIAKDARLCLPVDSKGNLDFKYMEDRVKALEQDRVKALANYLTITGLDDYKLTDSDRKVLSHKPEFKNYKIWDIFKVINTHSILKSQIEKLPKGNTPYLTAAEGNNAVFSYINCPKEWIDEGNCVFIGGKTMVVTYQEKDFCSNDSHNLALYFKQDKYRTPLIQQYFVGAIRKSLSQKYSWDDSISKSKIKKDIISLPIDKKNNIDFQYMENYIKAVQKLTIKNVVKYKDEVIDKTKEVINY